MAAAESCTPLHAWLHGGAIPEDDDCPIAQIHAGSVEHVALAVAATVSCGFLVAARPALVSPFVASLPLPDVRGPPMKGPVCVTA